MSLLTCFAGRRFTRRAVALTGVLVLALSLAGCFDNEPAERKAFTVFLQTRIIDKPGLHIPIMSDKEREACGRYATHYNILNGFHHAINASISGDFARAMAIANPRSLEDLANKRAVIGVIIAKMAEFKAVIDKAEAEADAMHKTLDQPADLKAVYDIAYARMVTTPARAFRELVPMIVQTLPVIERLAAYLDNHRKEIVFRGSQVATDDPQVRAELAGLLAEVGRVGKIAAEGKRKLRAMAEGK